MRSLKHIACTLALLWSCLTAPAPAFAENPAPLADPNLQLVNHGGVMAILISVEPQPPVA